MIRRALYHGFGLIAEGKIRKLSRDSKNPRDTQLRKLLSLLRNNAETQFGREHCFGRIDSIEEFQRAVPIRDYEQFRPYIEKAMRGEQGVLTAEAPFMFATTSGTSAEPKYIPVTPGYMQEFREASVVSGYYLLRNYPGIAGGATISIVSPAVEGRTPGNIPYGAISGQLFQHEPYLIKRYISPIPYEVYLIKDYESRYYSLLRLALGLPVSLFYTLNPSTVSLLCRRLKSHAPQLIKDIADGTLTAPGDVSTAARAAMAGLLRPDPERARFLQSLLDRNEFVPARIWPTLAVISCWTRAAAAFYLQDFPEYFGSVPICDITYGASEGRGTVLLGPGKQMVAIHSHFFEFVPEEEMGSGRETVLTADQLELGKNYYILFTTAGGLYRYNINDVVKVVGFENATPLIEFQYKGGNICSFTGEKITELQVTRAFAAAAERLAARTRYFTLVPRFRPEPHYELLIEFESNHVGAAELAKAFDEELARENIEYDTKRSSSRLMPVTARLLEGGCYESLRKHLVAHGVADAQIKATHLNPKADLLSFLESQ